MKHFFMSVSVAVLFSVNAFCVDYYSGKAYVVASNTKYIIGENTIGEYQYISLENAENTLAGQPAYDKVTGKPYSHADNLMPAADYSTEQLNGIISKVFSSAEIKKYFSGGCRLCVDTRINPMTCHICEISFYLDYTSASKSILSLPVSKIVELEKALKEDLDIIIPSNGKNASYLLLSGRLVQYKGE